MVTYFPDSWAFYTIAVIIENLNNMSRSTTKPTKWPVHPAKSICPVWSVFAVTWRNVGPLLSLECIAKALIRLRGCAGWSESSLCTHIILLALSLCGSWFYYARISNRTVISTDLAVNTCLDLLTDLSLVTRKPVFGVSDQVRLKPACSATKAS